MLILSISILLFKGFSLFGFLIFQFKNVLTHLCLSRDKSKEQFGKNAILTPTETLPKKQDYFFVNFQIILSTYKLDSLSILLFKGLFLFGFLIFQFKNAPTPLCLSRDKTKEQFGKNAILTLTKTLPKKYDYFFVNFQIILSTYKLNSL